MMPSPVFFAASGAHLCEELVSSCGDNADPYRRSMLRLLDYIGLQHYGTPQASLPPRSPAEDSAIAAHLAATTEAMARHAESVRRRNIRINQRNPTSVLQEIIDSAASSAAVDAQDAAHRTTAAGTSSVRVPPTIYMSFEDTAEWKAFLTSVAPEDRLAVTVRRRLTLELWRAHQRDVCLWCWFPRNMCMCAELDAYKAAMPARVLDDHVEVTMLLHSEELMRSTNSGHIAAYLLGAPLRVWGLDADDFYLRELQPQSSRVSPSPSCSSSHLPQKEKTTATVYNVSLYPSSESIRIEDFIRTHHLGCVSTSAPAPRDDGAKAPPEDNEAYGGESGAREAPAYRDDGPAPTEAMGGALSSEGTAAVGAANATPAKVHLILLDSTWGQALSLNRKLSRQIPRVKLEIPTSYESLFQALRKRTRESGVSTLEATSMAVEQCVRAMGYADEAGQTASTLTAAMKSFVDARCLLKYAEAQFAANDDALDAFRDRRDDARRDDSARRQDVLFEKMQHDEAARRLRLPPVLNYCYCCDCVIGWHRVAEHVMGRSHRKALEKNPDCIPSAASRLAIVEDFARPTRAERAAQLQAQKME